MEGLEAKSVEYDRARFCQRMALKSSEPYSLKPVKTYPSCQTDLRIGADTQRMLSQSDFVTIEEKLYRPK